MARIGLRTSVLALLSLVVAVITLAAAAAAGGPAGAGADAPPVDESHVATPTTATFAAFLAQSPLALVEFYAPWCGHCKHLTRPFAEAAAALAPSGIGLAKIDATVETKLASRFGVTGFPTLFVFRAGVGYPYHGGRTNATIVSYMRTMAEPSAVVVAAGGDAAFCGEDADRAHAVIVAEPGSDAERAGLHVAHTLRKWISFGLRAPGSGEARGLVVCPPASDVGPSESPSVPLPIGATPAEVARAAFASVARVRSGETLALMDEDRRPVVMLVVSDMFAASSAWPDALALMRAVAARFAAGEHKPRAGTPSVRFVHARLADVRSFASAFGALPPSGAMVIVADDPTNPERKFRMDDSEPLSADSLFSFVRAYTRGQVALYVNSQPAPAKHTIDGLTTVVGSTFHELVVAPSTDVFIELYSPSCPHCVKLEPVWADLAAYFKRKRTVTIAKMHAVANDAPAEFQPQGFPTLLFAPAGAKTKPIKYTGKRELADLIAFVEEHARTIKPSKGARREL